MSYALWVVGANARVCLDSLGYGAPLDFIPLATLTQV